jgi:hypothetical protein
MASNRKIMKEGNLTRLLSFLAIGLLSGCSFLPFRSSGNLPPSEPPFHEKAVPAPLGESGPSPAVPGEHPLDKMGFAIQVGAFSHLENAVRLEQVLDGRGIDAYYFLDESGLFKVRFGNHGTYRSAREEAERLQSQGLIGTFFIVVPEDYPIARVHPGNAASLRGELVKTARRFVGVPYRWGGTDAEDGMDCSGLTMVCYRLNGLNLPRVSRNQFQAGRHVPKENLLPGDLVFFATRGGRRVTHVGMYIGQGRFIHSPRTGQTVRVEEMSNPFFVKTYMGGRNYF